MVRRFTGIADPPRTQAAVIRIAGLAVLLLVGSYIGYRLGWFNYRHTVQHLDRIRQSHSVWAFAIVFVVVYALSLIHISEPTRLLSISYADFCLKKKKKKI